MQGIINVLALFSFATSAAIVGGGAYVYANRAELADKARVKVTEAITAEVSAMVPGLIENAVKEIPVPEVPKATGDVLPF